MLNFIKGMTDKCIREYVKDYIAKSYYKDIILIVPEQCSFQTEKEILEKIGEQKASNITVASFTRLCLSVFEKTGFPKGKRADDIVQNTAIHMCFQKLAGSLKIYAKYSENIEIISMIRDIISEFKKCNITPETAENEAEKLGNGELSEKMHEIALIYATYEAILEKTYFDPMDELSVLGTKLADSDFFVGKTVIIDAFFGFTMQEINVIKLIIQKADDVFISIPSDTQKNTATDGLFSITEHTQKMLSAFCKDENIKLNNVIASDCCKYYDTELNILGCNFLRNNAAKCEDIPQNINIYRADDFYDEINYVALQICKLVQNGMKYGEIAIVSRNEEYYSGIIENTLEKYDIPFFMDSHRKIDTSPLICMIFSLFDIIVNNFKTEDIMSYLKTGITGIDNDDVALLENYAFLWGTDTKNWLSDFTKNPRGFSSSLSKKDEELLERINNIRKTLIEPITALKKELKSAENGADMTKALYLFLEKMNISGNISKYVSVLEAMNCTTQAKEELRIWELFIKILDKIYILLQNTNLSIARYAKILSIALSSQEISSIPQNLDSVDLISVRRAGISNAKVAFIIGANEDDFPKNMQNCGLLTDFQRQKLMDSGFGIVSTLERLSREEEFLAYRAVSIPSKSLFVSYVKENLKGESKSESVIVREIKRIFPMIKIKTPQDIPYLDMIKKPKPSFEFMTKNWYNDNEVFVALKKIFSQSNEYSPKIKKLDKLLKGRSFSFENKDNAKSFFGKSLRMSASKIEKYYRCAFSYFCQYSLKAKPRKKAVVDALEYGSMIHFILENMLKNYTVDYICNLSYPELENKVKGVLDSYINAHLVGIDREDKRISFFFERWLYTAVLLVKNIAKELSKSDFVPKDFELTIANGNDVNALEINGKNGVKTILEGQIDRVDVMESKNGNYFRIIDYKTGTKEYNFSDLVYGINIQMLLYMTALSKNGKERYNNAKPAGVLYINVKRPVEEVERSNLKSKPQSHIQGIILNEPAVVDGMDKDGEILSLSYDKSGKLKSKKNLENVNEKEMNIIQKKVENLVENISENLIKGNIEALPLKEDGTMKLDACKWCDYRAVCAYEDGMPKISVIRLKRDEILKQLKDELGGETFEQ